MKKIGIIGGLGPQATIYYYQRIIDRFQETYDETGFPEIVIESLNLKKCLEFSSSGRWDELASGLAQSCDKLFKAGADFGLIASNTPHKVFDRIAEQTDLPLLSILETTKHYLVAGKFKSPLLLGTAFTMRSDFFTRQLQPVGIQPVVPSDQDIDWIHDKIFSEIEFNIINPDTRKRLIELIHDYQDDQGIDSVILGCTELPLIMEPHDTDLPLVNTAAIHADAAVERSRAV